jgi:hypothetical protein
VVEGPVAASVSLVAYLAAYPATLPSMIVIPAMRMACGRRRVAACGSVETEHGVEVDKPELLVLDDHGVRHPGRLVEQVLRGTDYGVGGTAQVEHIP